MVNQIGICTYFLAFSSADTRWEEFPYIIEKLNILGTKKFNYPERCNLLNNNHVLVARHVQYNVEVFFKGIILDVPLRKTKHCPTRIEFQERSIPNVHWFVWIFNSPNI